LDESKIPNSILDRATALGINLKLPQWVALSPSQRFALIKLSRPSHENSNFLPALREFNLI
jgi:hypothetical protein